MTHRDRVNRDGFAVGPLEPLGRAGHLIGGVVLHREPVDRGPEALDVTRDRLGAATRGAFKQHVLQKMCYSSLLFRFMATSGFHPNSNRNTFNAVYIFSYNSKTVW